MGLFALLILFQISNSAGTPASQEPLEGEAAAIALLKTRADDLRKELEEKAAAKPFERMAKGALSQLDAIDAPLEQSRFYAALFHFLDAADNGRALLLFAAYKTADDAADLPAHLQRTRARIAECRAAWEKGATARQPAAIRALTESLVNKAPVYPGAAAGIATEANPAGLFYAFQGLAWMEQALFLADLPLPPAGEAPPFPPMAAHVDRLEARVLAAYDRPGYAIDHHPVFIRLNAMIKEMREMIAKDFHQSAAWTYLRAEGWLQGLETPPPDEDTAIIRARLSTWRDAFAETGTDHSIAWLFIEHAEDSLAGDASEGTATAARALASLNSYRALIEKELP